MQLRSAGTIRSLTFLNTILMTTAFAVPAYAQIETVVVTAERKAEDIQTVPVAVTALTGQDLKARQVSNFRDLQFHVPSVTYTKSNFGGAQFQIRGITTQFGLGAAIAQNLDDIYIEAPALVTGEYYDVDRVEVLRGPQSTSYGRAATGGAVNVITTKPDLNNFAARVSLDYGSFNTIKPDAMVNVPIIDGELGFRLAFHASFHDGYDKNVYPGPVIFPGGPVKNSINSLGAVAGRASIRWEPSADTTVDLVADVGYENDRRTRGDKQLCHRDPSGVVGCLPDKLGFDPINTNSTLATTLGSKQGMTAVLNTLPTPFPFAAAQLIGNSVGLSNISGNGAAGDPAGPFGAAFNGVALQPGFVFAPVGSAAVNGPGSGAGNLVTPSLNVSNTAFNPKYKTGGGTYLMNWTQTITDWLKSTLDLGYVDGYQWTQQNYNNATNENISSIVSADVTNFNFIFGPTHPLTALGIPVNSNTAGFYDAAYFNVPGALPLSDTNYLGPGFKNYGGIIDNTRGGVLTRTGYNVAYDEDWYGQREMTGELRLSTNFDGPLNFTAGAFYMTYDAHNQYWVAANGLDYESIVLGASIGALVAPGVPFLDAMPDFDAEYRRNNVTSRSGFLEATYDVLDDLKVIAGARFNDDRTSLLRTPVAVGGGLFTTPSPFFSTFFPLGSTLVNLPVTSRLPTFITGQNVSTTDLWTGRVSINWTPKLDFTDQSFFYLTASRGELAGGLNVPNNGALTIVPTVFRPATVDSIEGGTKNTLLDGSVQANLTAWYYNYENYQVGIIANRQALTLNVPAHLFGLEGEFLWQPTEALSFNATISLTQSEAGHVFLQDQRNPTNNVPNSILIKDLTNGSNCVIVPISAAATGHTPGESSALHVNNFYLPNGGNAAVDAPFGIPLVNYGLCQPTTGTPAAGSIRAQLQAKGFDYAPSVNTHNGGTVANPADTSIGGGIFRDGTGFARDLHGNQLPQVPLGQVGVGAQYTWKLDGGYTLVPRVDYYWQSSMQSRLWNDPNIDRVNAWDTMNLNIQLNAQDNKWYAAVFAKNIFDKRNPTGIYLTDPTSALFTNVFTEDPRVIGISLGTSW
jgi:outer membrane receptor protein involved in Fe transport